MRSHGRGHEEYKREWHVGARAGNGLIWELKFVLIFVLLLYFVNCKFDKFIFQFFIFSFLQLFDPV